MLVSELMTLLRASELKQIKVGEDDTAVLGFINLAILEIHKEFKLQDRDASITIVADASGNTVREYTLDGTDPNVTMTLVGHSLLAIEDVYNTYGNYLRVNPSLTVNPSLRINDPANKYGIKMPTFNSIKFIDEDLEVGDEFVANYRATPDFLTDIGDTIPLTNTFIEALSTYVAYKAHLSVKSAENTEHMKHYKAYLAAIETIKKSGVVQKDSIECNKHFYRGFY